MHDYPPPAPGARHWTSIRPAARSRWPTRWVGESLTATLTSGHLALIEATYRATLVRSMLDKERLLDAGGEKEVYRLVDVDLIGMEKTM